MIHDKVDTCIYILKSLIANNVGLLAKEKSICQATVVKSSTIGYLDFY